MLQSSDFLRPKVVVVGVFVVVVWTIVFHVSISLSNGLFDLQERSGRLKMWITFNKISHIQIDVFVFKRNFFLLLTSLQSWTSYSSDSQSLLHWWSARLAKVVRKSLYKSIFYPSRTTKLF